jgi:hypothetical protein
MLLPNLQNLIIMRSLHDSVKRSLPTGLTPIQPNHLGRWSLAAIRCPWSGLLRPGNEKFR